MSSKVPQYIENRLFINGEFSKSSDGSTFSVKSPFNHEVVADVYEATVDDTNRAVAAAKSAFPSWSALDPHERGAYLKKMSELITASHGELASLDAISMGRPVSTYFDGKVAAGTFAHFAEAAWEAKGTSSLNTKGFVNMTLKQPVGVVAAIIPWNVPVLLFAHKVAPALASGCTVVLKSSEKAPLTSLKLASLFKEAGIPPGVINIISGFGAPSGTTLSSHMDVRLITFTGSAATGKLVQQAAAKSNLKRVILELGGKSPCVVFDDADMEQAVPDLAMSIKFVSGQACIATSRVYVQEGIAEKFKQAYIKAMAQTKIGDPLDPSTIQGPQADEIQFERIKEYLKIGQGDEVSKLALGGKEVKMEGGNGFFIEPTVFTDVAEDARTMKEEIFGPVVQVNTFKTEEEVIKKANDTEFGLYASVYTNDVSRALRMGKALEAGIVGVNCTSPTFAEDMPFGGFKQSGIGREGRGYSLDNYLETKSILMKVKDA